MNNQLILSTFIKQLDECIVDITTTYSTDSRFIKGKLAFDTIKKTNPKIIIASWKTKVTDKYDEQIMAGNIDYFISKDYAADLTDQPYTVYIDNTIHDLKEAIQKMSAENKAVSLKYIQNLCKLSKLYVY